MHHTTSNRRIAILLLLALLSVPFAIVLSGCEDKQDSKPDPGYYTGPMEPKSKREGKPIGDKKTE